MNKIDSQSAIINRSVKSIYVFISDFKNFEKFLPEQVTGWNATETTCSFTIPSIGEITLKMEKDEVQQTICYTSTAGVVAFELLFEFIAKSEEQCQLILSAFADIPAFMLLMVNKPIKNFIALLLDKIKTLAEASSPL
jgi:hypothetical protein